MSRTRGREPSWDARLPVQSAGQLANAVEVTFQIGETEFTRCFVDRFLARQPRGSQSENSRFHWRSVAQFVCLAYLKEPQIAIAVVQVPLDSANHADDTG